MDHDDPVVFAWKGDALVVDGALDAGAAAALDGPLRAAWAGRGARNTLVLTDMDLEDGIANALLVDLVRALRDMAGALRLVGAPQMLAHVLYKVGDLEDARITLVDPRVEVGGPVN
ncbi:MAG: hypothetical protein VX265_11165 [Myxococcota bacterium]|nr:hypothetical protein [Myxococcota bacterium]MEC8423378.1 hypothetical protein [Myxococcota bacterium]